MFSIPNKISPPISKESIGNLNKVTVSGSVSAETVMNLNRKKTEGSNSPEQPVSNFVNKPKPQLLHPVQKGMKTVVCNQAANAFLKVSAGWKINNPLCDVDISAFMLDDTGKVIGDDWFVFYGQTQSPDNSINYNMTDPAEQKSFSINTGKINPAVKRIVFVVTIDEALNRNLNFSMLNDVYIRISENQKEIVSYELSDYYSNVTSMMVGEIYLHNGQWKFNAIGNGVKRDLAGLCEFYGVNVV